MKISAFPKCWIDELETGKIDLFEWIELSTMLECEGLELMPSFLRSSDPSYVQKVRSEIEKRGMVVSMICHSPDFTVQDESVLAEEIEKQKEAIRLTAALGSKFCRTLSGQRREGLDTQKTIDQVVRCIKACLPEAEKYGVNLVIENHFKASDWIYPEFAQKMSIFLQIVNAIDSPRFGVQFDPSNSVVAREDPVELLRLVLPRVMTMHASDRYMADGYTLSDAIAESGYPVGLIHGVTGEGLNDYDAIFTLLRSVSFDGWISIEDGMNGMEEMKKSVDFLKAMRAKYFGEGSVS